MTFAPNPYQQQALEASGHCVVSACPGSGKPTYCHKEPVPTKKIIRIDFISLFLKTIVSFLGILHCPSKVVYTFLRRAIEIEIGIAIVIVIEMK